MADGPFRFPAFWGPGYDWAPDHNWGGSGMIGLQEMLLQAVGEKIHLFPFGYFKHALRAALITSAWK